MRQWGEMGRQVVNRRLWRVRRCFGGDGMRSRSWVDVVYTWRLEAIAMAVVAQSHASSILSLIEYVQLRIQDPRLLAALRSKGARNY